MQAAIQKRVFDRLAQLPTAPLRVRFVSRLHLLSPATVEHLDEAVRNLVRTDLKKAGELAEAALAIADALGDKESQAFALRAKANAVCIVWIASSYLPWAICSRARAVRMRPLERVD